MKRVNKKNKHMKKMQSIKQILEHIQQVIKFRNSNKKSSPNLIYLKT